MQSGLATHFQRLGRVSDMHLLAHLEGFNLAAGSCFCRHIAWLDRCKLAG